MSENHYVLVDLSVLPRVISGVLEAKRLLASGAAHNISDAAAQAGISRSAFYKYKDRIFDSETGQETVILQATLIDKTGALQSLLTGISTAGGSIVTLTQSRPDSGAAQVEITVRTATLQMTLQEMLLMLNRLPYVIEVHRAS